MYSVQNPIKSIPAHQLKVGQKFVKVINGNPCRKIYRFLGLLGGMAKCTSIEDNSPHLINQFYLVRVIPKLGSVSISSLNIDDEFSLVYGTYNSSPTYKILDKGKYQIVVQGSRDLLPRYFSLDTIVKFIPHA